MNDDIQKLIGKRCKLFIRNLSDKAIVYTGMILNIQDQFITILDRNNEKIIINVQDLIQMREAKEGEGLSFYQP